MNGFLNFTNNISAPQVILIMGGVFAVLEYFSRRLFKLLLDFKKMQIDNQFDLKAYVDQKTAEVHSNVVNSVQNQLDAQTQQIEACVHQVPGHPEAGITTEIGKD